MKRILAVALAASLAACSALQSQAPQKSLITSCTAYAAALNSAAAFREQGKLSVGQINVVDTARPLANALCTGPLPTDEASAVQVVDAIAQQIFAIAGGKP